MTIEAPTAVLVLWWVALGLTVLAIVPLALYLLHRTWKAAHNIRRYTGETLEAGAGIARHTSSVPALDETIAAAGPLLERTADLRRATDELAETLGERVG